MSLKSKNAMQRVKNLSLQAISCRFSALFNPSFSEFLCHNQKYTTASSSSSNFLNNYVRFYHSWNNRTLEFSRSWNNRTFEFNQFFQPDFQFKFSNSIIPRLTSTKHFQIDGSHFSTHAADEVSENHSSSNEVKILEDENDSVQKIENPEDVLTTISDPKELMNAETDKYFIFSEEIRKQYLVERLPKNIEKDFEACKTPFLCYRSSSSNLLSKIIHTQSEISKANKLRSIAYSNAETDKRPRSICQMPRRRHFLLEGPSGSGKSYALMTAVLWARANDWIVLYVPRGSTWTDGGFFFKFKDTPFWDTPLQALELLNNFLESNRKLLTSLPCRIKDELELGEGPGTGLVKGSQVILPGADWTLLDLVQCGIETPQCATSVAVRLRQELAVVTEIPVMIAIDEYNSWFTHSKYFEVIGTRGKRPIHASELRMVSAFRSMEAAGVPLLSNGLFLTSFSESIANGRIAQTLPGIPRNVRYELSRFSLDEAFNLMQFYKQKGLIKNLPSAEEIKRLYFLTNGNGIEMRKLSLFL